MIMKHILSLISVLLLLSLCVLPAFAEVEINKGSETSEVEVDVSYILGNKLDTNSPSKEIDVSYSMSQGYVVSIPDVVALKKDEAVSAHVSASEVVVDWGKALTVRVSSENYADGWTMVGDGGSALKYSIKKDGTEVVNNGAVLACTGGTPSAESEIAFSLTGTVTYADSYTDTLTFTVSVG